MLLNDSICGLSVGVPEREPASTESDLLFRAIARLPFFLSFFLSFFLPSSIPFFDYTILFSF